MAKKKYVLVAWRCSCGRRKKKKAYINCKECGKAMMYGGIGIGFTL